MALPFCNMYAPEVHILVEVPKTHEILWNWRAGSDGRGHDEES